MSVYSLEGQGLKLDTADSVAKFVDELEAKGDDVTEIRLLGNTLGIEACHSLSKAIEKKEKLQTAQFSDIFTGRLISEIPQSLKYLCSSLLNLPALVELDLSDNAFGGRSVEPMLELLSTHPTLSVLKLNNNGMGPAGGAEVAKALKANAKLAKSQNAKPSLKVLVCGRNRLENGSSSAFAEAFEELGSLETVRMFQNGIRMEGIEAIARGLTHCPNLRELDLQDNTATEKGSRAIAKALPSWPKLESLNLSDCLLRPRGGVAIMNVLVKGSNKAVKSLKLQSNELDARSVNLLASAIENHLENLTELELNGNYGEPEDECYERVRKALAKWEHEDALDELDELEEQEEEEEEEKEEEEEEEEEEADRAEPLLRKDEHAEAAEPKVAEGDTDGLVDAMKNVKIA